MALLSRSQTQTKNISVNKLSLKLICYDNLKGGIITLSTNVHPVKFIQWVCGYYQQQWSLTKFFSHIITLASHCSLFPLMVPYFKLPNDIESPLIIGLPAYSLPNYLVFPVHFRSKCLQAPPLLPATPTLCHNISNEKSVQGQHIFMGVHWINAMPKKQLLIFYPLFLPLQNTFKGKWLRMMLLLGKSWKYI